jgi:tetratricopeptide (TPR) repeat protein
MLLASVAHANPAAEKLAQDGRAFMKAGKLAEACDSFQRSHDLWPRYAVVLNLGDCEEKRGRIATAWAAFTQASRLANQKDDGHVAERRAEADRRANALVAKLPQLTVRTPATKPDGFVVKRDGKVVAQAELDRELPIDPGSYEFEASAPGHVTWKQTTTIAIGQQAAIEIPALAADPAEAPKPPPIAPPVDTGASRPSIDSPSMLTGKHRLGVGAAIGLTSESDVIYGVRFPIQLAALGPGALRLVPTAFRATYANPDDQEQIFTLYALGIAIEYVAPLAPKIFVGVGIGGGVDLISDSYNNPGEQQAWGAARLSPTLKLGKALDLGLHIQLVKTDDNTVGLAELGLDYFFF